MNSNYHKKKQPEVVRANLLDAAAEAIAEVGFAGTTLELVAKKAGVTKGGLFHHFPTKQALFNALNQEILDEHEKFIDDHIAADPEPRGRFIRACIKSYFTPLKYKDAAKLFNAFAFEMSRNQSLFRSCCDWHEKITTKYGEQHQSPKAKMIQYAADGIWLEECTGFGSVSPEERQAMIDYLIRQTYEL